MKKLLPILTLLLIAYTSTATSTDYFVNDVEIEQVLNSAELNDLNETHFDLESALSTQGTKGSNDQVVALILDFFLGGLAIHRVYLGGKGTLVLIYFITCGGIFGIVPLVDFFVMLINGVDDYVDNDKFIVW